jgi:4'-phosphopantetheinyl transferase
MPPRRAMLDHELQIWCIKLRCDTDLVSSAHSLLVDDERCRAERFLSPQPKDDFVVSRACLRLLLSGFGVGAPTGLRFTYGPQGKPFLEGDAGRAVTFNISHSDGVLACAFARGRDVGIDIEFQRPLPDYETIARRFFAPAEHADLMSVGEAERTAAFFDCWVRKEAFVKALGSGLSVPLDSFRVSLIPGHTPALLNVRDTPDEARAWTIHEFLPATNFSGAVAVRDPRMVVHVHWADAREVFTSGGFL